MAMATKTLNVTVEAYEALRARKAPKESFTDVILRLARPTSLLDLAGLLTAEEAERMREDMRESRALSMRRNAEMDRRWVDE